MSKDVSFGEFDKMTTEYLSELVLELLEEKGIDAASYSFSIDVTYWGVEDESNSN